MKRGTILLCALTLMLAGCGKDIEFPIPAGLQTVRAVLQPVPFSLTRRGTHALLAPDGKMAAYAESNLVNLHVLEGREVELQGMFEKNSDPKALPVLVVQKVLDGGEQARPWVIPALGLSIELPSTWKGTVQGKSASFTASGFTLPVLKISLLPASKPNPPYGPAPAPPSGELFTVGLRKATANVSPDRTAWIVQVTSPAVQVHFTFALRSGLSAEEQLPAYRAILKTVEFKTGSASAAASSSPSAFSSPKTFSSAADGSATSRAPGEGAPCGGPAGILCPKGFYCKIGDLQIQSGICAKR